MMRTIFVILHGIMRYTPQRARVMTRILNLPQSIDSGFTTLVKVKSMVMTVIAI